MVNGDDVPPNTSTGNQGSLEGRKKQQATLTVDSREQTHHDFPQQRLPATAPGTTLQHKSKHHIYIYIYYRKYIMTTSTPHNDALPVSTSDLTQEVQIRSSTQTQGQLPPKTIMQHFNASVEQFGNSPALHYKPSKVTYSVKWKEVL